jgi:Tol biopolymer transport system component
VSGGEARRLTVDNQFIAHLAWTADGREILFTSNRADGNWLLWRIPVSGGVPASEARVGDNVASFGVSREGRVLAYTQQLTDYNIWRAEITSSRGQSSISEKFIASTRLDAAPQYSPDGKSIAFASERSGSNEIWVCNSDGSNPLQVTSFNGPQTGTPRWSPDSKYIACDSRPGGNADIFVIKATGGPPRRLTDETSEEITPNWSRDGQWIYFTSNRSGTWQLWKTPVDGGAATQITRGGGFAPMPSPDGKLIYYVKNLSANVLVANDPLWRVPTDGGTEEAVPGFTKRSQWHTYSVTNRGIYFINESPSQHSTIDLFDFKTSQYTTIVDLEKQGGPGFSGLHMEKQRLPGLSVSPDSRWLLYTQLDRNDSDIMLAENFR